VTGKSEAPIVIQSTSKVTVQDTGVAVAQSGQAVGGASAESPPSTAPPTDTSSSGTSPTTDAVAATGLTAQLGATNALETTRVVPGGTAAQESIDITQTQRVSLAAGGTASASSGTACGGSDCSAPGAPALPTSAAVSTAASASGAASAQGLTANTSITTAATASVAIAGQNYAPIQIVIDAVSRIMNWGSGVSQSGTASTSTGGPMAPTNGAAARSGDAQATGASVRNVVDLSSSAGVHVLGDNHSPINIILLLAANFLNWGIGTASSGASHATGTPANGGQMSSNESGGANAAGLQVENTVKLKAAAWVVVDGNNYAPIFISIRFDTTVDNRGWAQANTGAVTTAADSVPRSANQSREPAATAMSVPPGGESTAQGGRSIARSDNVRLEVHSVQITSANAASARQGTDMPSAISQPVQGTGPPVLTSAALPAAATTLLPALGFDVASGAALAAGIDATVVGNNVQSGVCVTPEASCATANMARFNLLVEPAPTTEPSVPTIAPTPQSSPTRGTGRSRGPSPELQTDDTLALPNGTVVMMNPWENLPGRRLPPLPRQPARTVSGSTASANVWSTLPDVSALPPLPGPSTAQVESAPDLKADSEPALAFVAPSGQAGRVASPTSLAGGAQNTSESVASGPTTGEYTVSPEPAPRADDVSPGVIAADAQPVMVPRSDAPSLGSTAAFVPVETGGALAAEKPRDDAAPDATTPIGYLVSVGAIVLLLFAGAASAAPPARDWLVRHWRRRT
jgi:hypothetical protein